MVLEVQQRQLCWIGLRRKVRLAMLGREIKFALVPAWLTPTIPLNVGGGGAIQGVLECLIRGEC